jgi:hypothetical protein
MDSNHRCLDVGQESLPLDHGTVAVAEVGIEPTNSHQALDLAALPICVLGRQLRRPDLNRRDRLMRPCWNQAPVHSAVTKGRVELPRLLRLDVLSVACLPVPPLGQIARMGVEPIPPA